MLRTCKLIRKVVANRWRNYKLSFELCNLHISSKKKKNTSSIKYNTDGKTDEVQTLKILMQISIFDANHF